MSPIISTNFQWSKKSQVPSINKVLPEKAPPISPIICISCLWSTVTTEGRAVARSENLGGHIVLGGDNVPPLVEIGLTDLTKSGGARAPLAPPLATGLKYRSI